MAPAHGSRSVADGLAGGERRWRDLACAGMLFAALALVFPVSILLYIGAGQGVAVGAIAAALALMLIGWVIGHG